MEQMAGDRGLSRLGDGFPDVLESDIKVWPEHCGGPAVDLDGRVVGLLIARASRTRSFIIPAARVTGLLEQPPQEPAAAMAAARRAEPPPEAPPPRRGPQLDAGGIERRRQRLDEMRLFLERFMQELEALDER
jgi:S1-C subfamily serine protease